MTDASKSNDSSSTETEIPNAEPVDTAGAAASGSDNPASEPAAADSSATSGEIEKLRAEREELYTRYLRAVADLDNYRRRVQREKDELRQFAVRDLVENLLPVVENLGLAVASARTATDPQAIVTGVSMVLEQFRTALDGVGLVAVDPQPGSEFDPHQHESIAHAPSDAVAAEKILQVTRVGYSLKGRLLRPASVVLSSGPAAGATSDSGA
jgi:molecular chaperone GrpE